MHTGIEGKAAWVAGSSRGIGYAVAEALGREGARIAIGARDPEGLAGASAALAATLGRAPAAHPLNLADPPSVAAWAGACRRSLGPAEILFVNSGGPPAGGHGELSPEQWRAAADLLIHGAVNLVREVLPEMKAARWGRIVFLTSISVRQPVPRLMLSNSLRPAVVGFARSLADELGPFGITVNSVAPGYTRTDRLVELAKSMALVQDCPPAAIEAGWQAQVPLGRLGEPAEIASAVVWLASEGAAYVTGQMVTVDGGLARSLF